MPVRRFRLTGRPAQLLAAVNAVVALVAGLVPAFTSTEAGAINAVAAAVLGLVAVWAIKPFPITALIAVVNTGAATAVAFFPGLHFSQTQIGLVDMALTALLGLLLHTQASPRLRRKLRHR
jgi:hypothetical protein